MDILSFILGVCTVLVVASVTVGVVAFFKVIGLKKNVSNTHNDLQHIIDDVCRNHESSFDELNQTIGREVGEIYKIIDSRCDKLDNKITNLAKDREKNN